MPIDDRFVREALRGVMDAEAGMNTVDLGLVYGIDTGPSAVHVQITMTRAACPMEELIVDDAHEVLERALPRGTPLEVELVWDPPWTPEGMREHAREHFCWTPK